MSLKVSLSASRTLQKIIAVLSALSAALTQLAHSQAGFLSPGWAALVTSALAMVAAASGFVKEVEALTEK